MSLNTLKYEFHQLIDTIQDKDLLQQFLEAMQYSTSQKEGTLWRSLTENQQEKVMLSYEESLDKDKLIPLDEVAKKHQKWLTK